MIAVKRLVGLDVSVSFTVEVDSGSYSWTIVTKPESRLAKCVLDLLTRSTVRNIN